MRIGDVAVIAGEPVELPNDRVVSRSMDNRLGCFVALEAARLVAEAGGAPGDVAAVAVAQEEITFGGARTTAYSLQPDVAIAVDVTHATDAPGIDVRERRTTYRRLRRATLTDSLRAAGFAEVRWPEATGFYQPVVTARTPSPATGTARTPR